MTTKAAEEHGATVALASPNGSKPIGFDMGASEELAALEEQGIDVEWEDALGRVCYQPDGVTPLSVNVCGSLSKRYQKVQAIQRGRVLKATSRTAADDEDEETLGARSLRDQTEAVAACVNGWTPGFTDKSKPFTHSPANAVRILTLNPQMQRKLEKAMNDHARFFGAKSTGSTP